MNVVTASPEKTESTPKLEEAWFDEVSSTPPSQRGRNSSPPPSVNVKVGEFLGDELADSWLR